MKFESLHKTFNKQTNCLMTGNIIADTQHGGFIRPYTEIINPAGDRCEKGHLQEFDLNQFSFYREFYRIKNQVIKLTKTRPGILYCLKHYHRGKFDGEHRIIDAFVLTDTHYKLIRIWYISNSYKNMSAVDEAIKYFTK